MSDEFKKRKKTIFVWNLCHREIKKGAKTPSLNKSKNQIKKSD
jgi:hypothetical protein